MPITDNSLDERRTFQNPVARLVINNLAMGASGITVNSAPFGINGRLKTIKTYANITDATYTLRIIDRDGLVLHQSVGVTKDGNGFSYINLTWDQVVYLSQIAAYLQWAWTTSQQLALGDLQAMLLYDGNPHASSAGT